MLTVALSALSVAASVVGFWGFSYQMTDRRRARRLAKATRFPVKIRSQVTFSAYYAALQQLRDHIIDVHHYPAEVVVGVNYWGSMHASLLGRLLLHKWHKVDIDVSFSNGVPRFLALHIPFDLAELSGKTVLVVDNSIRSGRTLREVVDALRPHAREVKTLVICRQASHQGNFVTPDFVMFETKKPSRSLFK